VALFIVHFHLQIHLSLLDVVVLIIQNRQRQYLHWYAICITMLRLAVGVKFAFRGRIGASSKGASSEPTQETEIGIVLCMLACCHASHAADTLFVLNNSSICNQQQQISTQPTPP
jgi:hypothetical protein